MLNNLVSPRFIRPDAPKVGAGGTGGVDAVLIGDDLPELGTDLVTALTSLDVNELALRGEGR